MNFEVQKLRRIGEVTESIKSAAKMVPRVSRAGPEPTTVPKWMPKGFPRGPKMAPKSHFGGSWVTGATQRGSKGSPGAPRSSKWNQNETNIEPKMTQKPETKESKAETTI